MTVHRLNVTPRHSDGSLCGHRLTPSGKARETGCDGRTDFIATCTCGWQKLGGVKGALEYLHGLHRRAASTETTPAGLVTAAATAHRGLHATSAAELLEQRGYTEAAARVRAEIAARSGRMSARQAARLLTEGGDAA